MRKLFFIFYLIFTGVYAGAQDLNQRLYKAVAAKDTLAVEKLLSSGADANYKPKMGQAEMNLLSVAVTKNDFKCVKLLIDHKANVDGRDWFNTTPLMYAANGGNLEIIKYLLQKGADVKANDGQGNTVLSAAKEKNNPEVIKLIEDKLKE
ncbi:ankyrin repeat domain-containing protein [Mucilaginibacter conchicola]|uniref:Ankyrin repeat domain-containing protein n=1 Tax=Mucilaginibacter conchicola TaxID=2303333 RepID=A0A372P1P6_9SPHI|nr:ankyrin repeat domain-containing protein [Mucilaginibacter conchicola]RFZ95667.1 ankyrin repeat domain-containing protein [Mucilaginibacter conchicola]